MPSKDFYANVTRITLNKMRLAGIKIPAGSDGIKVTKAKLRSVEVQKHREATEMKLSYNDMKKYVKDFDTS